MTNISTMLSKRSTMLLLIFGFAASVAFGQGKTITGVVSSQDEGPLPGVNIVIQGTQQGIMTGPDGSYSIAVPGPDAVLVFSFISYATQSINVGDRTTINVTLVPELSTLNEVVVVGYGTQQRREVTSSIAQVKSNEFVKGSVNNPVQLIQGKVSGLSITKPGGNPNEDFNVRLRGLSTIGANTDPLVVIDGIIGGSLENVDPNDIESINVLKDGSAAAIYGTRGSSGVILVTTKRGKQGQTAIEYNAYVTAEMVAKAVPVMDATEWRALHTETGLGTDFGASTDWFDETTQTAFTQVHNLAISGGSGNSTYRASINYRDADGVQINTDRKQLNGRINIIQKALNEKLTIDLNLSASQTEARLGFADAFRYATVYNPTAPVRSTAAEFEEFDGYFQQILFDYYNPVQILEQNFNDRKDRLINASVKGTYQIVKGLNIDAFYARQSSQRDGSRYYDKNSYWTGRDRNGRANKDTESHTSQLFESTLNYNGDISPNVSLNALGGYSYQDFVNEGFNAEGGDFLTDAFTSNNLDASLDFLNGLGTLGSFKDAEKLIAFFGRINVNINSTWFLTASARYEGSSRFGTDNKWGLFPAVGGGVDIAPMINSDFIDNLKVRASYGVTGNRPNDSYRSLLRLGPSGNFFYNGVFSPAYGPVSNANTDLKWEKKGEFDMGFDFSVLNSKLSGSFDFYTRTSTDLLFTYEVPSPPNLFNQALLNLGEIKSSGIELTLNWNVVAKNDFTYSISFTPSYNLENTLVSLSGSYNGAELSYGQQDLGGMGAPGQSDVPLVRAEEGKPIGQLLALKFKEIDPDGNLIFEDLTGEGEISTLDRAVVGNAIPDLQFGFGNTLTYKKWDMNVFFRSIIGHDLINSYRAFYEVPRMIGSYNLPETAADMRNAQTGTLLNNSSGVFSDYHVENASFLALDNLSLGYNIPMPQTSGFSRIRIYAAGNNLFYITGYKGVDPTPRYEDSEDNNNTLVPGVDRRNTWFRTRSVSFGVNVIF